MTESNVFNMTVKREGGGLTAQSAEEEQPRRCEEGTNYFILASFHTLSSVWFVLLSWICLQHASSLNRPGLLSKSASAAGSGEGWGESLLTSLRNTHTHTHTHTHITILERTQYGFPLIPWKITKSSNPNICSGGDLTVKSASPSACEPECLRENSVRSKGPLSIIHCAAEPKATPCQWWDLTRPTSQLSVHTQWESAHSRSQEQDATLKSFHSFRMKRK